MITMALNESDKQTALEDFNKEYPSLAHQKDSLLTERFDVFSDKNQILKSWLRAYELGMQAAYEKAEKEVKCGIGWSREEAAKAIRQLAKEE